MSETRQGNCPKCGGESLDYAASEPEGESLKYPYTCEDCGFEGIEWYNVTFAVHTDNEGNEV